MQLLWNSLLKHVRKTNNTINTNTQTKQKHVRGKDLLFRKNFFLKAIMHRTRCYNRCVKKKTNRNERKYAKKKKEKEKEKTEQARCEYHKYANLVRTQVQIISDPNYLVRILFER